MAVRGPHHRDLALDPVESDGAVRKQAFDLPLAFELHAELGEECDGGVQVVDDDGDVVHPLNGHVCQHTNAASRQSGAVGTDPPWDPALVYPAAGIAGAWAPVGQDGDALAALVGQRRAQILRELDRPASTLRLARPAAAGISAGFAG